MVVAVTVTVRTFRPSIWEAKAGGSEFKAGLVYIKIARIQSYGVRPYLTTTHQKKERKNRFVSDMRSQHLGDRVGRSVCLRRASFIYRQL